MSLKDRYDVVVVGGSVGGCVLGLCYARHNLRVAVLEQKAAHTDYKRLCTHFIQPMALPVLRELGLDGPLEEAGAVRTKAAFWTPTGWIDPPEDYGMDPSTAHAYNIERRILDPLLRERLRACGNVDLRMANRVIEVSSEDGEWRVETLTHQGREIFHAKLVVAADGRNSQMARFAGNDADPRENQRGVLFGYFDRIDAPLNNRSLFILSDPERGFFYPLCNGRTLLTIYVPKTGREEWQHKRDSFESDLKTYFQRYPGVPDVSRARLVSPVYGYRDYPNLLRKPVMNGVPFVGDAALSLDPLSGVGCAFAIVAAAMLAEATTPPLLEGARLDDALAAYASRFNKVIFPHARGIMADSLIAKSPEMSLQTYRCITSDAALQREFVDLTGRLISPMRFQTAYASAMVRTQLAAHRSE